MKGNTKKLYQNVSVSKPKKFGNQNTNSINVIVNPNDADNDEEEAGMPVSKIAQLNALNKQGMSPMEMNFIQQEALRNDEPINGQTISQSNQELNDAEDLRILQQGAVEQLQERVMEGEAQEAMDALNRLQSDVLNSVRYQVEKEEAFSLQDEAMNQLISMFERQNEEDVEAFQREQDGLKAQLLEQQENTRMMNEELMARQRDLEEERVQEREYAREHMIEMKELEDEVARMTDVINTHMADEEIEEGFNTPNQLTPPPPQYTSPLMETFEEMKRERTPEVRKRLPTKAPRGQGKKAQYDKASTENFLNREK